MSANPASVNAQSLQPDLCNVFIQVWVDVNALAQGSTQGCYAVSNRSQQSNGEGTAQLITTVPTASRVCWSVVPIDPQYQNTADAQFFTINAIGVGSGWDAPPTQPGDDPSIFTGSVSKSTVSGNVNADIEFSCNTSGTSVTVTLPVQLTVQ
ncbi:hypothetical protein [Pseudoduganella armeniaca]|nr:hypothetical protein [Pseudoduganella armeniaca]